YNCDANVRLGSGEQRARAVVVDGPSARHSEGGATSGGARRVLGNLLGRALDDGRSAWRRLRGQGSWRRRRRAGAGEKSEWNSSTKEKAEAGFHRQARIPAPKRPLNTRRKRLC